MICILYFPEDSALSPVTVEDMSVPAVGSTVWLQREGPPHLESDSNDFDRHGRRWLVAEIHYSLMVFTDVMKSIRSGKQPVVARCEVHLTSATQSIPIEPE